MADVGKGRAEVAAVVSAALIEAAKQGDPSAAIVSVLPAALGGIVRKSWNAYSRRQARKTEAWFHEVAAAMQYATPAEVIETIEAHVDEPWAHTAVVEGVRAILQDIDEAAIPFLARSTAEAVVSRDEDADRRRRATALLVAANASVLEQLRRATTDLLPFWPVDVPGGVFKIQREASGRAELTLIVDGPPGEPQETVGRVQVVGDPALSALAL